MYAEDNRDRMCLASDDGTGAKNPLNGAAWTWTVMDFTANPMNWDPTADIMVRPLWAYNKSAAIYRCPGDQSTVVDARGVTRPRVRSYSMNFFIGGFAGGNATEVAGIGAFGTSFPLYYRLSQLSDTFTSPGPSKTFVFIDERSDCITGGGFMADMSGYPTRTQPAAPAAYQWDEDMPASYHGKACGLSFADGHSEIHGWKVASTTPPLTVGAWRTGLGSGQVWPAPYSQDVAWMQDVSVRPK
jgi:hypothetical protein